MGIEISRKRVASDIKAKVAELSKLMKEARELDLDIEISSPTTEACYSSGKTALEVKVVRKVSYLI